MAVKKYWKISLVVMVSLEKYWIYHSWPSATRDKFNIFSRDYHNHSWYFPILLDSHAGIPQYRLFRSDYSTSKSETFLLPGWVKYELIDFLLDAVQLQSQLSTWCVSTKYTLENISRWNHFIKIKILISGPIFPLL